MRACASCPAGHVGAQACSADRGPRPGVRTSSSRRAALVAAWVHGIVPAQPPARTKGDVRKIPIFQSIAALLKLKKLRMCRASAARGLVGLIDFLRANHILLSWLHACNSIWLLGELLFLDKYLPLPTLFSKYFLVLLYVKSSTTYVLKKCKIKFFFYFDMVMEKIITSCH